MKERKPFDPAARRLLQEREAAAAGTPAPENNQQRVQAARAFMVWNLESRTHITGLPNDVSSREVEIAPWLQGRVYLPSDSSDGTLPVLVYFHGGGWVVGSVAVVDPFCRLLCEAAHVSILSIDYRLAPEHPYPAALDDAILATRWAFEHASGWGGDPERVAIGGDSAGGNLAAATANHLCTAATSLCPAALVLLYPVLDHPDVGHPSYSEYAKGYGLEAELMRWFVQQYAAAVPATDEALWPLQIKTVPALPPTLVATAEYDVLRDEGIAYAEKLQSSGVAVTHMHSPDMGHNFPVTPHLVGRLPQSNQALHDIAQWLKSVLAHRPR